MSLTPRRMVTFHREDLLPYEQDLYDSEGNLETHVTYAGYREAGTDNVPLDHHDQAPQRWIPDCDHGRERARRTSR